MARKIFRPALAVLLSFVLIATLAGSALAADGDLDPAFGGDGKVRTNFTTRVDLRVRVAIQTDGQIVAAGAADRRFNRSGKFALAGTRPRQGKGGRGGGVKELPAGFAFTRTWRSGCENALGIGGFDPTEIPQTRAEVRRDGPNRETSEKNVVTWANAL